MRVRASWDCQMDQINSNQWNFHLHTCLFSSSFVVFPSTINLCLDFIHLISTKKSSFYHIISNSKLKCILKNENLLQTALQWMFIIVLKCVFRHTHTHSNSSTSWMVCMCMRVMWMCLYMWMRVLITHREIVAHSIHVSNNWRHLIHTNTHIETQARELSDSINHVCIMLLLHLQFHWY